MTREEMIEQLENTILLIKQNGKDWWDERDIPILQEAIQALQTESCEDAISRQEAISVIEREEFKGDALDEIEKLPSVQPVNEVLNNSINLCDSCKYDFPECPSGKDDVLFGDGKGNDNICCCNKYQQAQKLGKWIFHKSFDNGHKNCNECIECSQCHTWLGHDCYAKTPYCPMCGCRMEEGE